MSHSKSGIPDFTDCYTHLLHKRIKHCPLPVTAAFDVENWGITLVQMPNLISKFDANELMHGREEEIS